MKARYGAIAISLLTMVASHAATISWSSTSFSVSGGYGQNLNAGQFDSSGTLILAENTGGSSLDFDGITFSTPTIGMGFSTYDGFHDSGANTQLARFGAYGSAGSSSTVNLSGLTNGHTYRIQALVYDGRGSAGITGRTVSFDGINQGQYANGINNVTWGNGLLVTGTFVADSSSQSFSVEAFSGSTSVGGQLNAITLYQTAIPEVSSFVLGSLGMLTLLRRRR